ncbi:TPT-domain-containing protein [Aulographum hederae CBS 113979]|uniref:TPT-domain-containing protein n=1 Tax=Aulographum hederae CBS 113979 TaxID=1176131 RepID=A0A6G1GRB7_9PEZI|nr:TPT-domain-containing protein [Aulographum hederae CBS 113979]
MDELSPHNPKSRPVSTTSASGNARVPTSASRRYHGSSANGHSGDSDAASMTSSEDHELDEYRSDEGLEDDEETGLTGKERERRRRRKQRNTRLDGRIAGDLNITKEAEKVADQSIIRHSVINALLICSWYFFSISISIYNKWMFSDEHHESDGNGEEEPTKNTTIFPFPLFTTCMHMLVQFSLASLVLYFFPKLRPSQGSIKSNKPITRPRPGEEPADPKKSAMTWWFYCTRVGPCGTATAMDIGLGNMSLKYITLTFYTMCKSSVLGFVLIFAFMFRLEKPSWKLGAIIATMTLGVIMMVAGETSFDTLGFALVMTAAASSGFRWSLTQILLLRNPATSNPFASIFFLAPVMFVALLIIALPVEGVWNVLEGVSRLRELKGSVLGFLILLFPGTLAFAMVASEFALLQRTSVVTLSICGIFKEVVTISAASIVFKDELTPINISGVLVTIACIAAYNYMKITKMREEARLEAQLATEEKYFGAAGLQFFDKRPSPAPKGPSWHKQGGAKQS